jgi:Domain of unknown function (DUF4167)
MNTTLEVKPGTAQPRPKAKNMTHAMPLKPRFQKTEPAGFRRANANPAQNAQREYQRYMELARAEALSGDPIAAENYLQHAEHYLRVMSGNSN